MRAEAISLMGVVLAKNLPYILFQYSGLWYEFMRVFVPYEEFGVCWKGNYVLEDIFHVKTRDPYGIEPERRIAVIGGVRVDIDTRMKK